MLLQTDIVFIGIDYICIINASYVFDFKWTAELAVVLEVSSTNLKNPAEVYLDLGQ